MKKKTKKIKIMPSLLVVSNEPKKKRNEKKRSTIFKKFDAIEKLFSFKVSLCKMPVINSGIK